MPQAHEPSHTDRRLPGRPARLTRSQVVAAARRIAAKDGLGRLSMRRLAVELDVMPNALYTHFPDKAAILDAVLDDLLGDVEAPRSGGPWRDVLVSLMSSYRRLLLTQPGLAPLTVSRPMIGPNAMRLREDMLTLLRQGTRDEANTVAAFLTLFAYTTGFVAFEAARTPGEHDASQRARAARLYASLSEEEFPTSRALASRLAKRPGDAEFRSGLLGVIAGFAQ
ncbi:MAG: TetR/AcrR family transcriptional regulator C-terminal domain-containing protein [Candidatus Limnocylindria bacterium]